MPAPAAGGFASAAGAVGTENGAAIEIRYEDHGSGQQQC
jgi:hypothetical protein